MKEETLVNLIGIIGGCAGLWTVIRAVIDHKANRASREADADDRLVSRLERRLDAGDAESDRLRREVVELRRALDNESRYTAVLSIRLARAGIDVPPRP